MMMNEGCIRIAARACKALVVAPRALCEHAGLALRLQAVLACA